MYSYQKRFLPIFLACWFGLTGAGFISISFSYLHTYQAEEKAGFYAENVISDNHFLCYSPKFSTSGILLSKWLPTGYLSYAYFYLEETFTLGIRHALSMSIKIIPELGIRDLIFPTHFFW
ncbi:hypothetical protein [Pleomorphovibrio marinus]|uniref:hypothetical protein n=1 Tax=Pleomorphovibrio marinus TaxID=2164132 RepID=UPI000E0C3DFF|nr:hypothetical protein [Pleomorphovibrio marinus]